jgi:hypothetical protein
LRAGRGFGFGFAGKKFRRVGAERLQAVLGAEMVGLALVIEVAGRARGIDRHPADGVYGHAMMLLRAAARRHPALG